MDVETQKFTVRLGERDIRSVSEFAAGGGSYGFFEKEGIFARLIGFDDRAAYFDALSAMDRALEEKRLRFGVGYLRLASFDSYLSREEVDRYADMLAAKELPFTFAHPVWQAALVLAHEEVLRLFGETTANVTDSMRRNFEVKLLCWMERYLPKLFPKTKGIGGFPKLVITGKVSRQEYLFLYLLVRLGCDVLYLNPFTDLPESFGALLKLSRVHICSTQEDFVLPAQLAAPGLAPVPIIEAPTPEPTPPVIDTPPTPSGPVRIDAGRIRRADRERRPTPPPMPAARPASRPVTAGGIATRDRPATSPVPAAAGPEREPLSYEELAGFASSVVMIQVYNDEGECFKSGSGVFVNAEGYVLTNFHVVRGGSYFGVRLEEHEDIYYTQSLIKYHDVNDLALLKIDVRCRPIPLYTGMEPLKRGQKVLAIGSPLGLFNSVSDGIVSGFRKLDQVSMVQFTAPTSPGSSGGALLDLYGNLIGILTAGFDGQNLNLAVDYNTVRGFVRGFI